MKFIVYLGVNDEWYWRLESLNKQIIAISGNSYKRRSDCIRAVKQFREKDIEQVKIV
jgi:uncharacterized protein YegP (UPF0339 family)